MLEMKVEVKISFSLSGSDASATLCVTKSARLQTNPQSRLRPRQALSNRESSDPDSACKEIIHEFDPVNHIRNLRTIEEWCQWILAFDKLQASATSIHIELYTPGGASPGVSSSKESPVCINANSAHPTALFSQNMYKYAIINSNIVFVSSCP